MPSELSKTAIARDVLKRLRSMFPEGRIGLHEPWFPGNEQRYVTDCVQSGWVSSVGAYVDRFEAMLTELTGATYAVAVTNGTAALHLALHAVGVQRGDEVLSPALTFVATANSIAMAGATPHFVDTNERTLGMDASSLDEHLAQVAEIRDDGHTWNKNTNRRISVCMPVHIFGHPAEIESIIDVCTKWGITVVEDAAESLGSIRNGKHTGTFGKVGALSFNGNKLVTTGGGGAVLTMDEQLGKRMKHLSTTAKAPHQYEYIHDEIAFNYRMPNLNAALGCAQLEGLPNILERKRFLAARYAEVFTDADYGRILLEPESAVSNYWLNALVLNEESAAARDEILQLTNDADVMTRPFWRMLPSLDIYNTAPSAPLPSATSLERRVINLPSSGFLRPAA